MSRRPDYTEQARVDKRTAPILRTDQVDTSALDGSSVRLLGAATSLQQSILDALPGDPEIGEYLRYIRDPTIERGEEIAEFLTPFSTDPDGLVLHDGRLYIPASDTIKLQILRDCHDGKTAGHLGQDKTLELTSREYYWPRMRKFVNVYIRTCDACARNKTTWHHCHG